MTNPDPVSETLRRGLARRIHAAEDICEIPSDIRDELDRRLADQEANPGVGMPWSEVKARLLGTG